LSVPEIASRLSLFGEHHLDAHAPHLRQAPGAPPPWRRGTGPHPRPALTMLTSPDC